MKSIRIFLSLPSPVPVGFPSGFSKISRRELITKTRVANKKTFGEPLGKEGNEFSRGERELQQNYHTLPARP